MTLSQYRPVNQPDDPVVGGMARFAYNTTYRLPLLGKF